VSDREELDALRRLDELEQRAAPPTRREIYERTVKQGGWGSGLPKLAYDVGGKITDALSGVAPPEVAGGAGYAANVLTQAIPSFLTSGRVVDAPQASMLEKPARALMQGSIKPAKADLASGAADEAVTTMLHEGISPTRSGMDKVDRIVKALDQQVERGIAGSTANVNVPAVTSRLNDPMARAGMQVNPKADTAAVENAWTEFLTSPHIAGKSDIPVQLAHALKKGTYKALGSKSYGEVGSASTEAQKALARGLREEVGSAVPNILEPLKREASLMNVRDVAMNRALSEANKNPMGLAALRIGDNPMSSLSFMADRSAALKAALARALYTGGQPQVAAPLGVAAGTAAQNYRGYE
jgi:hypothetical protein